MKSYPFTSQVTYDEHGMPKYDRAVDSEFLRQVNKAYYSDGVFYDQSNRLQVVADTGMQVKVMPGVCHVQGAIGIEENERTLQVQAADTQDRIDTVVARLDLSLAMRKVDLYIVKGTPADSPQAPALTRDGTTWELGLANLFVAKNTATISQERITDTRLDTSRCGMVGATVKPPFDTEAFFSQLEAAIRAHQEDAEAQIEQLRKAIEAVEGDSAWMMKELYDPAGLGKDVTTQVYIHSKSGTVHNFAGTGANGRAKMTADVQAGDTFTVNGTPVTAYMGTDDAVGSMAGSPWNGKWVSFIVEGDTLNFKGGGGKVTVTGLTASKILNDTTVTVKQGAKTIASVKGTIPPYGPQTITPTTRDQSFGPGVYLAGRINVKGDPNLVAGNIRKGVSVFGVAGTLITQALFAFAYIQGNAAWQNAANTHFESPNAEFTAVDGQSAFTVNVSGTYNFKVMFASSFGADANGRGSFRLMRNGGVIPGTELNSINAGSWREFNVALTQGDVIVWQLYGPMTYGSYTQFLTVRPV